MPRTDGPTLRVRRALPHEIVRGSANTLRAELSDLGASVTISAASVVVRDAAGLERSTGSATVAGSVLTYAWTPATTEALGDGWQVEWSVTIGGVVTIIREDAALVLRSLSCPVSTADLYRVAPAIDPDGDRPIAGMTAPEADSHVQEAWVRVLTRVSQGGRRPWLIVGASALREPVLMLALHLIFDSLAHTNPDQFRDTSDRYKADYEAAFAAVQLAYANEDGTTGAQQPAARNPTLWLG